MPQYKVTAPDGSTYQITAPDDATPDQVQAYAQANYQHPTVQAGQPIAHAVDPQTAAPVDDPSLMQRGYDDSAALLQNAILRPLAGVAQMGAHSLQSLTNAGASTAAPGSIGANIAGYVNDKVNGLDQAIHDEEANYQKQIPNRPDTLVAAGVGNVLPYALGAGEANIPRAATTGGRIVQGALTAGGIAAMQPVTSAPGDPNAPSFATQKAEQVGLGTLAGGAGPAAGVIGRGIIGTVSPEAQALAQKAAAYGIDLTGPQISKSIPLKVANSTTAPIPFSGATAALEKQQGQFNNAVAQTIGLPAGTTKITPDVFSQAKQTIGQGYDDLAARNNLTIDPPLISKIQGIVGQAHTDGDPDAARAISNITQELIGKASQNGSAITGPQFQSLDSRLGRLAANPAGGDKAHYAGELQDALRESMEAGMSPADAAKSAELRSQWRNVLNLTPILTSGDGNVPPSRLLAAVANNKAGKTQLATGNRGDLGTLAQIGKQFMTDPVPNSGTALRNMGMDTLKGLGAVGAGSVVGVPAATALPAATATVVAARLIQSGLRSRALYNALANLPPAQQTPVRNALNVLLQTQAGQSVNALNRTSP